MESAVRTLVCTKCGSLVVSALRQLVDEAMLDEGDGHDRVPQGTYFVSLGKFEPEEAGDYLVNLKDLQNTKRHSDVRRLNGCCGLDGCDGPNLLCENGHEIGTERSDCWHAHHAVLSHSWVNDA